MLATSYPYKILACKCESLINFQRFPGNLLASTFPNPENPEEIRARSELERREEYVELLESKYGSQSDLVKLVKRCLHNVPSRRPNTKELLTRLQEMNADAKGQSRLISTMIDLAVEKVAMPSEAICIIVYITLILRPDKKMS